jgi:phosphodiesterase/alkaline phosphatase D-like protein
MALALAGVLALPAAALAQTTYNSVTLSWTTPGDDSLSGIASQFDLRYSTSPITTTNFAAASRFLGTPAPATPGTRQSVTVTGLSPTTTYYFAIKTGDEVPNWAGISNVISRTTLAAPDTQRPASLAINVSSITDSTATVSWVAVGDDSLTGTATSYDVRYFTSPITATNWAIATQASNEPTPSPSGTSQNFTVRGLSRQVTYYFAVKVTDEAGNVSALSNVPSATTPDTAPPAAILDLSSSFVWFGWRSATAVRPRALEANRL